MGYMPTKFSKKKNSMESRSAAPKMPAPASNNSALNMKSGKPTMVIRGSGSKSC